MHGSSTARACSAVSHNHLTSSHIAPIPNGVVRLRASSSTSWKRQSLSYAILAFMVVISIAIPATATSSIKYMDGTAQANAWYWSGTHTITGGDASSECPDCSITIETFKNAYNSYQAATGSGTWVSMHHDPVDDFMERCKINGTKHMTCHLYTP